MNAEVQNVRCIVWSPDVNFGKQVGELAAGLPNGKVVLTSPSTGVPHVYKEFTPQHARACNSLAWNPHEKRLLAAGLEKVRFCD